MPSARSRTGNHSAITLAAPGQFPASPSPSRNRKQFRPNRPLANACAIDASDQTTIEMAKPRFAPIRSYSWPESPWLAVYAIRKTVVRLANSLAVSPSCFVITGAEHRHRQPVDEVDQGGEKDQTRDPPAHCTAAMLTRVKLLRARRLRRPKVAYQSGQSGL